MDTQVPAEVDPAVTAAVESAIFGYIGIGLVVALIALVVAIRKGHHSFGGALFFSLTLGFFWPLTIVMVVRKKLFQREFPQQSIYQRPWEKYTGKADERREKDDEQRS
ncbi:hypothetical protein [Desulfurispira natronophila]|uniref:Uncharacterized protein n=1 Tax=Desulfurispira natronophila TaxID=682562 RepID=A0A7W8DHA3_9BACT|nr:hypothetical protein [Desulfurispira natronophila]MBB5022214.1 hypothetical protein [Desulfurispira natronophila]